MCPYFAAYCFALDTFACCEDCCTIGAGVVACCASKERASYCSISTLALVLPEARLEGSLLGSGWLFFVCFLCLHRVRYRPHDAWCRSAFPWTGGVNLGGSLRRGVGFAIPEKGLQACEFFFCRVSGVALLGPLQTHTHTHRVVCKFLGSELFRRLRGTDLLF